MKKNKNYFLAKYEEYNALKSRGKTKFYFDRMSPAQIKEYTEKKKIADKEHDKRQERMAEILADRKRDDFTAWYLSRTPDIQNEIRIMARDKFSFTGPVEIELKTIDDYLSHANDAQPTARFAARYHALRVSLAKDKQIALFLAQRYFESRYGQRRGHWIDAKFAAAILEKHKNTFLNKIRNGTYSFTTKRVNSKVVLYDGNEVLGYRLKRVVLRK